MDNDTLIGACVLAGILAIATVLLAVIYTSHLETMQRIQCEQLPTQLEATP